jgi:predicted aspartyl protease
VCYVLRVVKEVGIRFMGREATAIALFDTGSNYTIIRRSFFEKAFGAAWTQLPKPIRLYLVNGKFVTADKYAVITIVIDDVELSPPETVLILDEFVEEIVIEGRRIRLPDAIIGAGTMDKYGIVLDPKEGVKVLGTGLLL